MTPPSIALGLLLGLAALTPAYPVDEKPAENKTGAVVLVDATGKEHKVTGYRITAGTRRLGWLAPDSPAPAKKDPEKKAPKGKRPVVATEGPAAAKLLGWPEPKPGRAVMCLYFATNESPIKEPTLVLDADNGGPVNNLAVMSAVAASYAPPGQALISVSVLGDPAEDDTALIASVRKQLVGWYGEKVNAWRHLRTYRIRHALPDQTAPALDPARRPVRIARGLYVCGDHRADASINGALMSGWQAAQAVAEEGTGR